MTGGTGSLKVLHLISSGGLYGAEQMLLGLASECKAMGHQPIIGTILNSTAKEDLLGAEARLQGLDSVSFPVGRWASHKELASILAYASKEGVQIVHAHGYKAIILLGLVERGRRPCSFVCTLHGWTAAGELSKLAAYEWLARRLSTRFDRIVPVSSEMLASIDRRIPKERIVMIPNGIRVFHRQVPIRQVTWSDGRPVILAIGRLSHEKGFDILLEAAAALRAMPRDFEIVIAGEGKERRRLEVMIRRFGLQDRVELRGFTKDVEPLYRNASVLVIPSRSEGLPMVLLEAMMSGVPVVATEVGEIPAVLKYGALGEIVPPRSPSALAAAICRVLDDPTRSKGLAERSRQAVEQFYSSRAMAARYCEVYQRCVAH